MRAMTRAERNEKDRRDRQKDRAQSLIVNALIDRGPMTAGQTFAHLRGRIPWPLLRIYLDQLVNDGRVTPDMQNRPGAVRTVRAQVQDTFSVPAGDLVSRVIAAGS